MQARFDIRTGRLVRIHVASRKGVRAVRADDGALGIDSDDFDYVFNGLVYMLSLFAYVFTMWRTLQYDQCLFKGISYHKFSL